MFSAGVIIAIVLVVVGMWILDNRITKLEMKNERQPSYRKQRGFE